MELNIGDTAIALLKGDITGLAVDAIVNAANSSLILGSGVAGAIADAGGPSIQDECNRIGSTPVGTAVITGGGNLRAKYVIHAVGPIMGSGDEDRKLADATQSTLALADQHHIKSIAIPAISTGVFGYPIDRCARIMLTTTVAYIRGGTQLTRIFICLFDDRAYTIFDKELNRLASH